jgi:hypothetical protein
LSFTTLIQEIIMKSNLLALCVCAAALWGLAAPGAAAQDDRVGTAAMEELLVPVTPRTVALGSALTGGLSTLSGVEAVQSNPAALLSSTGTSAMFSRTEYVADIGINYVGIAQRFGSNSIAITVTNWDYGDIFRTTEASPEINPELTWSASVFTVGATYGRQFTDRIAAGVTLKGLGREIDNVSAGGVAFDAGVTYVVGESGLRFGVSLKNFGTEMSFEGEGLNRPIGTQGPGGAGQVGGEIDDLPAQLPSTLDFGASYTRQFAGNVSLTGLANFRSVSYDLDQYAAGVELGYADLLFVRGGVNLTAEPDMDMWESWNVGAGLNLDVSGTNILVDYAYRPTDRFGGVNMFSVGLGL